MSETPPSDEEQARDDRAHELGVAPVILPVVERLDRLIAMVQALLDRERPTSGG